MKSHVRVITALLALAALLSWVANGFSQDYVAAVFTFGASTVSTTAPLTKHLAAFDAGAAAGPDNFRIVIPRPGTLKNLYWYALSTSTLTGSNHKITVLKNGNITALETTWNAPTTSKSNIDSSVSVVAGDKISVRIQFSAGASGSLSRPTVSFELSVPGTPVGSQWTNSGSSDIYYDAGNVGIGATTPSEELTVVGTVLADTLQFSDGSFLTTKPTGGGGANSLDAADSNPADAVFVDNDGKVGIGTTTPQEKLTKGPGANSATEMFTPSGVTASVVAGGNLSNGWYYFRIVATDGVGTTIGSAEVSRQITGSPNRRIALSWSPVQGATGYRIYKGSTSGGQDLYHVSPASSFNYDSDAGADPGTVATVTTAYVNKVSSSGSSWVTGGNFGVGTTIPQEELTLASGSNSVTEMAIPTGVTAAVIAGGNLPIGTHYFRIVATDGQGTTAGSAEVSGVVSNTTNDRIQLSWSPVLGAVKYRVYGGTTPGGQNVFYEPTNTTFDYDSHSNPDVNPGSVPPATTAYINKFSAAGNSWMLGGNVGIGTTTPAGLLDVETSIEDGFVEFGRVRIRNRASGSFGSPGRQIIHTTFGEDLRLGASNDVNAAEHLIIKHGTGNVGIGTTSPGATLDLKGNMVIRDGQAINFRPDDINTTGTIAATTGGLFLNGNIGLGVPNPTSRLQLPNIPNDLGNGLAAAWTTYSSRRWKTNIQTIEGALDRVQRLRGVSYELKENGAQNIGLIAEEVGEVIPEVVTYEENGKDARALDYSRLVAVLIEAVKEQQKQIDELKTTIKSLATK